MTAMTLKLDDNLRARLETMAEASGEDLSAFVSKALRMFVDDNDATVAAIEEGVRQADAGEVVPFEEVKANLMAKIAALKAR